MTYDTIFKQITMQLLQQTIKTNLLTESQSQNCFLSDAFIEICAKNILDTLMIEQPEIWQKYLERATVIFKQTENNKTAVHAEIKEMIQIYLVKG